MIEAGLKKKDRQNKAQEQPHLQQHLKLQNISMRRVQSQQHCWSHSKKQPIFASPHSGWNAPLTAKEGDFFATIAISCAEAVAIFF